MPDEVLDLVREFDKPIYGLNYNVLCVQWVAKATPSPWHPSQPISHGDAFESVRTKFPHFRTWGRFNQEVWPWPHPWKLETEKYWVWCQLERRKGEVLA